MPNRGGSALSKSVQKFFNSNCEHTISGRLEEAARNLSDLEVLRGRLTSENSDLDRKLQEADSQVGQLQKLRVSLETQLNDALKLAEDETKERVQLMSRYR